MLLILAACYLIVDVRESKALAEFVSGQKNTVAPDPFDWNDVLHPLGDIVLLFVLLKQAL